MSASDPSKSKSSLPRLRGLAWTTVHTGVDADDAAGRRDVREMMVHLFPMRTSGRHLGTNEWHTLMSIGAGLSGLKASRLTDERTVITGVLSDHPPIRCEFGMKHSDSIDSIFCLSTLAMFAN